MKKGLFLAIEGPDGSGKTTTIKILKEYLEEKGYTVVLTREPGGTLIGEKIREILLDSSNENLSDRAEALLYAAARAQHIEEKIKPNLKKGFIVITDRFYFSSLAYQGYGRGLGAEKVMDLSIFAINGLHPDKTLFFDITPETALARKFDQGEANRMEEQGESFHKKTYNGYKKAISLYNSNVITINANGSKERTAKNCIKAVNKILNSTKKEIQKKEV